MEKIGLIQREANARDARVSYVLLAPGGKQFLTERLEKAELLSEEALTPAVTEKIEEPTAVLLHLGGTG